MLAKTFGVFVLGSIITPAASAATFHVPADHSSVQAGVNAASPGDTVLVAPGSYKELVRMKNGIVLRSADGPDSTFLRCAGLGESQFEERILECMEDIDRSAVIEGFTFETDPVLSGTAIQCEGGSPTVRGNVIRGFGWGLQLRKSNALIEGNIVEECTGFGILVFASSPEIVRNVIRNNGSQAISISGKESRPVIGGSRENANRIHGNSGYGVVNHSRNDIDATWNDWGWEITAAMNREGWPADISTIQDGNDLNVKVSRGRGKIDYRNWITAEGEAASSSDTLRLVLPAAIAALVLVALFLIVRRVSGTSRAT